jgi:hypothetical protein
VNKSGKIGFIATVLLMSFLLIGLASGAKPPTYSCSDTDGGNYPWTFGTVSGYYNKVSYSYSDYCIDTSNVKEYYCNGVYWTSQDRYCGTDYYGPNFCYLGDIYDYFYDYSCGTGRCQITSSLTLVEDCLNDCINVTGVPTCV